MVSLKSESELVEARTLRGFRDLLPDVAMIKSAMLAKLRKVFESFGYVPIETPHLEYAEVLLGQGGAEINKQIYRFRHGAGEDAAEMALRFDLTLPLARYAVQHRGEIGMPFKRYAIGEVFRGEKPQAGRYREFTQCDFDIVGADSVTADAETAEVIAAAMQALGVTDFTIRLNNRKVMNGLAQSLGVLDRVPEILRIIDKLEKLGLDGVKASLAGEVGLGAREAGKITEFIAISAFSSGQELFKKVAPYRELNQNFSDGLDELEQLYWILSALALDARTFRIDFSVARGLGYYTGTVYETYLHKLPKIGSVCSGGRYDDLTKSFSTENLPGVGASVGIDRLIAALKELGLGEALGTPAEVLFTVMNSEVAPLVHKTAWVLRRAGINVEVYPDPVKLKRQFEYANRKGHAFVVTIGPDEVKKGTLQLKNMKSGRQEELSSLEALIEDLKKEPIAE